MDWGKVLTTWAEGANPEAFARARAQKEEQVNNEQRRQLLASQESRAQAGEARESEKNKYDISRRSVQEEMDVARLEAAGLTNEQARLAVQAAKQKEEIFNLAGGAQGEANETMAERRRKEEDQKIEQSRLALEGRRTSMAEELGALESMTREEQLKESQRKNRFGTATYEGAVEAENYSNSEEAREERRRAANLSGLRNAGTDGPIYDSIANDLLAIEESRRRRRGAATAAPPQKPVKERAGASAGAWGKKKPSGGAH